MACKNSPSEQLSTPGTVELGTVSPGTNDVEVEVGGAEVDVDVDPHPQVALAHPPAQPTPQKPAPTKQQPHPPNETSPIPQMIEQSNRLLGCYTQIALPGAPEPEVPITMDHAA